MLNFTKNKGIILLATSVLLTLSACGTRKIAADMGQTSDLKTNEIVKQVINQQSKFDHLTINSKIKADLDDVQTSLNGKIYVHNGNKIWVNISKFGVNGARALITPNGFQAFERIGKTYIDGDFSYFNRLLKVDFIDYQKLQNLMLGKVFVDLKAQDFASEIIDNQYVLTYKENNQILQKPQAGKYVQTYKFNPNFQLVEAILIEPKSKRELNITYSNWVQVKSEQFPQNVKVIVKDKKQQQVELEYNNFTFEQIETPFEIPSGYKQNDILK